MASALLMPLACSPAGAQAIAQAEDSASPGDTSRIRFDIPALPLAEALQRYGHTADRSMFFETRQLADRRSSPVQGLLGKDEALHRLLDGTGLSASSLSPRVFTVEPAPRAAARPRGPSSHYDGYLQRTVMRALCSEPGLHADRRRIALRFSVADSRIRDLRVRVAEQPSLEPRVRDALMRMAVDAPPAGVGQPVVMIVSPEAARRWGGCPQ